MKKIIFKAQGSEDREKMKFANHPKVGAVRSYIRCGNKAIQLDAKPGEAFTEDDVRELIGTRKNLAK